MPVDSLREDLTAIAPTLAPVVARREHQGHMSAVVPRHLLTHPLWFHPKTASCTSTVHRTWWDPIETSSGIIRVQRHTEQANPLSADGRRTSSPHGLLRFLDLDVVMALSYAWLRQGDHIEIAQANLLRWMGYDDLLKAPYDELRASLERLTSTSVALWDGQERPTGTMPFRLVDYASIEPGAHPGARVIRATVNRFWLESLKAGRWQEVDLDAYAHLTRQYRRHGLARVIYCYLTANRDASMGAFKVLKDALVQRYAPRKPDGRSLRYADHGNPNSALVRSMQILRQSGVIEVDQEVPDTHIAGRFSTAGIPALAAQANQQRICTDDIWGGGVNPKSATPLIGATNPPIPATGVPAPVAAVAASAKDPVRASVIILNREIRCNKSAFAKAQQAGWLPLQMLHLMAEVLQGMDSGTVQRPGALLAKLFTDRTPGHYTEPPTAAWTWLKNTGWPSLPVFAVGSDSTLSAEV